MAIFFSVGHSTQRGLLLGNVMYGVIHFVSELTAIQQKGSFSSAGGVVPIAAIVPVKSRGIDGNKL